MKTVIHTYEVLGQPIILHRGKLNKRNNNDTNE